MASIEYDEYDAVVRVPKGAKLPKSKKTAGAHRGPTRDPDTNKSVHPEFFLNGENKENAPTASPPVFVNVDECNSDSRARERSELDALLVAVVLLVAIEAAQQAAPHLKRWWNDQALPFMKSTRNRLARTRKTDNQADPTESTILIGPAPAKAPQEVIAALEQYRANMSSSEARERFISALLARLFSEEQMRVLRNARIENENVPLELSAMEALTPQQVGDSIKLMLEKHPSLLDEETLTEFWKVLARNQADSEHVPLRNEEIQGGTTPD
ncbi:hypothetical protein [Streptosporangium sp. H16]|uniref:hypothetical protein n=1 Tax=Streptosporangium sp. H16 TaxID=3444184 RepID=UPI003F79C0B4